MIRTPSDSQQFEIEAQLRLEQARQVISALLEGHWQPDPGVVRHIGVLAEIAARFYERAGWCDWHDWNRAA